MTCPQCGDTGWKPVESAGVRRVVRCDCWQRTLSARLVEDARIPPRYHRCDLESFRDYNDALNTAVRRAKSFVARWPAVEKGLLFLGTPGVGKTHLAVAVLRQVVTEKNARGLFYDTRDLLRDIRSTYNPQVRAVEMDILRPVMNAELLVLDDLGAEKTSEWVEETLNLVVNTRYNERRATILTSNYVETAGGDPADLTESIEERVGYRMWSRLHEMCEIVTLEGTDFRQLPKNWGPGDLDAALKRDKTGSKKSLGPRGARAHARDGKADLKYTGGRAGT